MQGVWTKDASILINDQLNRSVVIEKWDRLEQRAATAFVGTTEWSWVLDVFRNRVREFV